VYMPEDVLRESLVHRRPSCHILHGSGMVLHGSIGSLWL